MEIPCQYIFKGDVHKVKKSISVNEKAVKSTKEATSNGRIKDVKVEKEQDVKVKKEQDVKVEKEQDVKRIRLDTEGEEASSETNMEWVRIFNIVLKILDRDMLLTGQELNKIVYIFIYKNVLKKSVSIPFFPYDCK